MFCKKCGTVISENALFCTRCGASLAVTQEGSAPVPAVQPQPAAPAPVQPMQPVQFQQPIQPKQPIQPIQPVQPIQPEQSKAEPVSEPVNAVPLVTEEQKHDANDLFVWGIVGLAFSSSFFLSFLGIIFSSIARNKAKAYIARYHAIYGKAKVGNILSKVGVPLGIGLTILCILYITFYVLLLVGFVSGVFTNY